MLERVPEVLTQQFVDALKRYRNSIADGHYDSDAVELLQLVLLSHSNNAENLAMRDQAMERLYDRTYGTCMSCQGEISEKRLIALPLRAKLCRNCQEEAEQPAVAEDKPKKKPSEFPKSSRAAALIRRRPAPENTGAIMITIPPMPPALRE